MKNIKYIILLFYGLNFQIGYSQSIEIQGGVVSSEDIENIHIINKSSNVFTVTNALGRFKIRVKLSDTLTVSSIQHKLKTVIIDSKIISDQKISITLEPLTNSLDEILIGKVLTGSLLTDVGNVEDEPITPNKVGIPSYQGKPKTQTQRRLNEATTGGGLIPLFPIINAISGRTKQLKLHVLLEAKDELMYRIKTRLSEEFFKSNPLDEDLVMDFFYFCSEDENFLEECQNKSDFEILIYLKRKYGEYMENIQSGKN